MSGQSGLDVSGLLCCFTQDFLDDPVSMPCGHLASRTELVEWIESEVSHGKEPLCPKCRASLDGFDPLTAPKMFDLIQIIEDAKLKSNGVDPSSAASLVALAGLSVSESKESEESKAGKWRAELVRFASPNQFHATRIGKLTLNNTNQSHLFRTLVIPVIDHSGSMEGGPIHQAQDSLRSIIQISYQQKTLATNIVAYSSAATSRQIDTSRPTQEHEAWIANLSVRANMQGTSFEAAFQQIIAVVARYKDDPTITSIEIIFLTDGQDSSHTTPQAQQELLKSFQNKMQAAVSQRPWNVHSVGFGAQHDAKFLDALRQVGSSEGAYRYADPNENVDSLISKIQSVVNVIVKKTAVPIKLEETTTPILEGDGSVYYMDVTKYSLDQPYQLTVNVNGERFKVEATISDPEDNALMTSLWDEWYGLQIDKIARELKLLNTPVANKDNAAASSSSSTSASPAAPSAAASSLERRIHFEFLINRSRAIASRLSPNSEHHVRLSNLIEMVRTVQGGESVDTMHLNDLSDEGKYKTVYTNPNKNQLAATATKLMPATMASQTRWVNPHRGQWDTFDMSSYGKLISSKSPNELIQKLCHSSTADTLAYFADHLDEVKEYRSEQGCTLLTIASSFNRGRVVKWLLEQPDYPFTAVDSQGNNALDVSIINGTWFTYENLYNKGLRPLRNIRQLLCSCLSKGHDHGIKMAPHLKGDRSGNKYFRTAALLFRDKLITEVKKDTIDAVPWDYQDVAQWLTARSDNGMSLQKALQMGMSDIVDEILKKESSTSSSSSSTSSSSSSSKIYSLEDCFGIFANPTPIQVQLVAKLLQLGKIDITQTVKVEVPLMDGINVVKGQFEEEISWPLYAAAEKGRLSMVQLILNSKKEDINRVNKRHCTALWMSACNGHIDVVMELLAAGADPNIVNEHGSSALIPCCRKGLNMIASLLLEHGLSLEHYVRERDHPILQCCRDGQAEVLETILSHLDQDPAAKEKWLLLSNPIDGLPPLLAATELGHVNCVKVCLAYGAPIEWRTSNDNQIIAGATALHVAAFNRRLPVVAELYASGCDITSQTSVLGYTVMHIAVIKKHGELIHWLRTSLKSAELAKLNVKDLDGHLPSYYAYLQGNEHIRDEFFVDRLAVALEEAVNSDESISQQCARIIQQYGRTIGCYDYDQVVSKPIGGTQQTPILTKAILNGNAILVNALRTMGADWYQPDIVGLTPVFWALMMGQEALIPKIAGSEQQFQLVQSMTNRVQQVLQSSTQVKLLLSLTRGAPQYGQLKGSVTAAASAPPSLAAPLSELQQMSDGFGTTISPQALVDLRSNSIGEISLMGWLEKLKTVSVFPPGRAAFEKLMWDAKVHVIGKLAIATSTPSDSSSSSSSSSTMSPLSSTSITPIQLLALYMYTAHPFIFEQVNQCLITWSQPSPLTLIWKPFILCLYQSIQSLPDFEGECYRAIDQPFNGEQFGIGQEMSWSGFTMCSLQWTNSADLIQRKRGMIFILKSTHARIISPYSAHPGDSQVVFLPGSRFRVTHHYIGHTIALQQMNIREQTYKLFDYSKVNLNKACIMIELEQI